MRQVNFNRAGETQIDGGRREIHGQQFTNEPDIPGEPFPNRGGGGMRDDRFRHPGNDSRIPPENDRDAPPPTKKICRFYSETGFCTRGEDCDFLHECPNEITKPAAPICRFFAERGYCTMEDNCEYSHEVPSKEPGWNEYGRKDDIEESDYNPYDQSWRQYADEGSQDQPDRSVVNSAFLKNDDQGIPDSRIPSAFLNTRRNIGERDDRPSPFENPDGVAPYWAGAQGGGGPESQFQRPDFRREEPSGWPEYDQIPKPSPFNRFMPPEPAPSRGPSLFLSSTKPKCKQYKIGKCTFGIRCKFSHEEPEDSGKQELDEADNTGVGNQDVRSGRDFPTLGEGMSKRKADSTWDGKNGKRFKPESSGQQASIRKRVVKPKGEIGMRDKHLEEMVDKALKRVDLKLCIQLAIQACKKCGDVIMKKKNDPERKEQAEELEEECCNILATAIARKYPLHTIVSRLNAEGITEISRAPTWCISSVDRLDNFVRGSELVCISIGLCVEKRPVLGVIYNPIQGHLFAARRKAGTFVNKSEENKRLVMKPVTLKSIKPAKEAVISNEYCAGDYRNGLAYLGARFKETGSISNNFLDVLRNMTDGGFQATFEGPWSVCAGVALIEEAGGLVTDLEGNLLQLSMNKREIVYGPRKLVEEMLHLI